MNRAFQFEKIDLTEGESVFRDKHEEFWTIDEHLRKLENISNNVELLS